jgi:hypothetical protein
MLFQINRPKMGQRSTQMARYNDENVPAAIQPHLKSGEVLRHYAYGVKQPNVLLMLLGPIVTAMLTKNYIVAMTDRRLLVLEFHGELKVTGVTEYALDSMPAATGSVGMIFTRLQINDSAKPFRAKFHRMGMPNNRMHSTAILEALNAA